MKPAKELLTKQKTKMMKDTKEQFHIRKRKRKKERF